jgi:transglycosylase-like protein with SLT domain
MTKFISLLAGVLFGVFALSGAEAKDGIVQNKVRFQTSRIIGAPGVAASLPHPGAGVNPLVTEGRSVYRGRNHWHRFRHVVGHGNWGYRAHGRQRTSVRHRGYFAGYRGYHHRGFSHAGYHRVAAGHAVREGGAPAGIREMIARHAAENGVPVALAETVIRRESRFQPNVRNRSGATGLMQIMPRTARGMGFSGSASGLLEPETNLHYGMKYLAMAYRASGGDTRRAMRAYGTGVF